MAELILRLAEPQEDFRVPGVRLRSLGEQFASLLELPDRERGLPLLISRSRVGLGKDLGGRARHRRQKRRGRQSSHHLFMGEPSEKPITAKTARRRGVWKIGRAGGGKSSIEDLLSPSGRLA